MRRFEQESERSRFLGYVEALFALPNAESIVGALRELSPASPFRIRMKVLYSRDPIQSRVEDMALRGLIHRSAARAPGFVLAGAEEGESRARVSCAVLPTEHQHVSVLVTVSQREEWQAVLRVFRREYPDLVPILLSQRELLQSVNDLRLRVAQTHEIRVREISKRESFESEDGKRTRSVREWTDERWAEVERGVAERKQVVTSVSLGFHRRLGDRSDPVPSAFCKVSKRGEIDFSGRYDLIWDTVVRHIADAGRRKLSFFSNRGLRERAYAAAPLAIEYKKPVFDQLEEVRRLVEVLRRYPHSIHSVQHGNPYAYVQIADMYDGSSFDVWALSPQRITVVPRLRATEAALDRVVQYIFDQFREGDVTEASPSKDTGEVEEWYSTIAGRQ